MKGRKRSSSRGKKRIVKSLCTLRVVMKITVTRSKAKMSKLKSKERMSKSSSTKNREKTSKMRRSLSSTRKMKTRTWSTLRAVMKIMMSKRLKRAMKKKAVRSKKELRKISVKIKMKCKDNRQ